MMARRADAIRVVSKPQYERLLFHKFPVEKITYLPCAIDTDFFKPPANALGESHRKQVLFAGRLEKEKNPLVLLAIARELKKRKSGLCICVYGDGFYRSRIEQDAARENLPIDCFGTVRHTAIADALSNCLCVLLTSHTEGTPRIILEAFASARPCVVSDAAGNRSVVSDGINGFCVPVDRADLFAERLMRFEANPKKAEAFGREGRKVVCDGYSLDALVPGYHAFYKKTLESFRRKRRLRH
jgi:glycosyltransferase involved in cell wall biosynthesis